MMTLEEATMVAAIAATVRYEDVMCSPAWDMSRKATRALVRADLCEAYTVPPDWTAPFESLFSQLDAAMQSASLRHREYWQGKRRNALQIGTRYDAIAGRNALSDRREDAERRDGLS